VEIQEEEKGKETIASQKIKYCMIYIKMKKTDTKSQTPIKQR
jgi:hypothetical protein